MLADSDHQHSLQMALLLQSPQLRLYTPSSSVVGTCYTADLPTGVRSAVAAPDSYTAEQSLICSKVHGGRWSHSCTHSFRQVSRMTKYPQQSKGACTIAAFFQSVAFSRPHQLLLQCPLQWRAAAVPGSQLHRGPTFCALVQ